MSEFGLPQHLETKLIELVESFGLELMHMEVELIGPFDPYGLERKIKKIEHPNFEWEYRITVRRREKV